MNNLIMPSSWRRGFATARAAREYSNGKRPGEKLGASLFSGSSIVAIGFNTYEKSHPSNKIEKLSYSIHAEHSALLKRKNYVDNNLILYVYREIVLGNKLTPSISKPCPNCLWLCSISNIKRIRYFNDEGQPEELKL